MSLSLSFFFFPFFFILFLFLVVQQQPGPCEDWTVRAQPGRLLPQEGRGHPHKRWDKQIMGVHIYTVPGVEPWWRSLPLESHATLARGPMAVIVIKLIINFILLF